MRKLFLFLLISFFIYLGLKAPVFAIYDPREVVNNRFGIHIIDENDLQDAASLVNSTGGDWGYVKLVITEEDRNLQKWQETLNKMRRLHLIPILRLATRLNGSNWEKPTESDIDEWVDFLNKLNWVTENRYVVFFNEPNHAKEWGGELNPEEYAVYLKEFSKKLRTKSSDFFILPAGLDASAPNSSETIEESLFISRMVAKEPDIFNYIDGWSSHSYPNPGFVGSPFDRGRGSVGTFLWEKNLLSSYTDKNLPIFILETGWLHSEGKDFLTYYPSASLVAEYYQQALSTVWSDPDLVTVIPFLLNYQDLPFDHFSWKKPNSSEFNEIYKTVKSIAKVEGKPKQKNEIKILSNTIPKEMIINSTYVIKIPVENKGQSVISKGDNWNLYLSSSSNFNIATDFGSIEPKEKEDIELTLKTPKAPGLYQFNLVIGKDDEEISKIPIKFNLISPPSLSLESNIWLLKKANGNEFKFIIYDENQKILFEEKNISFIEGKAKIKNIYNIVPGKTYRFVLTTPYYLPRQIISNISSRENLIKFPLLLPLDPSSDGALTQEDLTAFIKEPRSFMKRLLYFW